MSTGNETTLKQKQPRLWLRLLTVVALLLIMATALGYKKYLQIQEQIASGSAPVPPTSVTVAVVQTSQWQNHLRAIGTLVASQGIDITSEATGIVKELNFESGDEIKRGDLLVSLNNEIELAALSSAQAQYESANSQYQRSLKLRDRNFVTENEIEQQRWAVNSAKSQVESALAALNKKKILAPFSGKLGIRNIDIGDYASPGTKLVTLQAVDTLFLDFTLPERNFNQLATKQPVKFKVRSYSDQEFEGEIQAWDPNLDENTRNVKVRAIVTNYDRLLAPGMFAEIDVESTASITVTTVPETSIFYNIYGEAVYVLEKPDNGGNDPAQFESTETGVYTLAARQVKVLFREKGVAGVAEGLNQGDTVVTAGQLKLFPSLKVVITDDVPDSTGITSENLIDSSNLNSAGNVSPGTSG